MNAGRVFVTGGNGFLGTSVIKHLAADGIAVTSGDIGLPAEAVAGVEHVIADVTDAQAVSSAIAGHGTVVHLAAIVNPGKGSSRELEHRVDVDGTSHVLQACTEHGVGRIIVSSSGAAYGYHQDNAAWLSETDPIRGNAEFAYSDHKRLVEEMLAGYRISHPELQQTILRIGTILGASVDNQITALFEKNRLLKIAGADSPFVFVWDEDLTKIIVRAVTGERCGVFNVAGDGALTIDEIASLMGKSTLPVPEPLLRGVLAIAKRLGLTAYGPEQTKFLQYRPVLANTRLKEDFGYTPALTSREAFVAWMETHGS